MISEIVSATRTVRRYREEKSIGENTLLELLDLARLGGSARNSQPLRYLIINDPAAREKVFPHLGWAGYLTDWPGPGPGERPSAYIVCLLARRRCPGPEHEAHFDLGISTQNMLLGAAEKGIFGCRIASFSRKLQDDLQIDEDHKILLVLAMGYPAEKVVLEEVGEKGDIRYWRDDNGVHHVPKRSREDILYHPSSKKPR